jgi:hypothetical protein
VTTSELDETKEDEEPHKQHISPKHKSGLKLASAFKFERNASPLERTFVINSSDIGEDAMQRNTKKHPHLSKNRPDKLLFSF